LRLPPGVAGTVVEVRVFNRHGIDKDERALAIEREEIERLAKDRDDEQAILDRNVYGRLADYAVRQRGLGGPKGYKKAKITTATCSTTFPRSQWWTVALERQGPDGRNRSLRAQYDESKKRLNSASSTRSRSCSAATSCRRA
jgi:DNA-directed RNA polymerase subunit beta